MSRKKKLFNKIKNNPKNVSYEELISLLEKYDCIIIDKNGSHFGVTHELADRTLTVPRHKPIGKYYVKDCLKLIEEVNQL